MPSGDAGRKELSSMLKDQANLFAAMLFIIAMLLSAVIRYQLCRLLPDLRRRLHRVKITRERPGIRITVKCRRVR